MLTDMRRAPGPLLVEQRDHDRGNPAADNAQLTRGAFRQINDTAFHVGAAVVDQYFYLLPGVRARHPHLAAKGQAWVRGGKRFLVKGFTTGSGRALEAVAVEGRNASLCICLCTVCQSAIHCHGEYGYGKAKTQ